MTTSVFLNNDRTMPLLGLGLYKTTDAVEAEDAMNSSDVELPNAVFQEKIFLSQPRSGTTLSVLVM